MNGVPLLVRAGAPRFGFKPDPKLATLGG